MPSLSFFLFLSVLIDMKSVICFTMKTHFALLLLFFFSTVPSLFANVVYSVLDWVDANVFRLFCLGQESSTFTTQSRLDQFPKEMKAQGAANTKGVRKNGFADIS